MSNSKSATLAVTDFIDGILAAASFSPSAAFASSSRRPKGVRLTRARRPDGLVAASLERTEQAQRAGALDRLGVVVHAELGVDLPHVRLDRAGRDADSGQSRVRTNGSAGSAARGPRSHSGHRPSSGAPTGTAQR